MANDEGIHPTDAWERVAKNIVRAELMRRGLSYAGLAEALAAIGIHDNEANLRNKVGRGRFTTVFFLQCLSALGVDWLRIPALEELTVAAGEHGGQALAAGRLTGSAPPRRAGSLHPPK
jgi:hypothetical protein